MLSIIGVFVTMKLPPLLIFAILGVWLLGKPWRKETSNLSFMQREIIKTLLLLLLLISILNTYISLMVLDHSIGRIKIIFIITHGSSIFISIWGLWKNRKRRPFFNNKTDLIIWATIGILGSITGVMYIVNTMPMYASVSFTISFLSLMGIFNHTFGREK